MARLLQEAVTNLCREDAQNYFFYWNSDLRARMLLIDLAESVYAGPGNSSANMAVASLMHAADYLYDRIAYEMEPHPKGMIRLFEEPTA